MTIDYSDCGTESHDSHQDVLQNIEFGIVSVYRDNPEMTDYAVMRVLEALIDHYIADKIGRPPRNFSLSDEEKEFLQVVNSLCDWRLGRSSDTDMPEVDFISVDEIIQCLKRILKSVQTWNKLEGRQGYLRFVSQFVP